MGQHIYRLHHQDSRFVKTWLQFRHVNLLLEKHRNGRRYLKESLFGLVYSFLLSGILKNLPLLYVKAVDLPSYYPVWLQD